MKPSLSVHDLTVRAVHAATGLTIEPQPHRRSRWDARLAHTWATQNKGEWSPQSGLCKGCAREIDTTPTPLTFGGTTIELPATVCEDCMELVREHYDPSRAQADEDASTTPKWDKNCAERHKEVAEARTKPPEIDWVAFEKVKAWRPTSHRGLVLVGPPGTGKTSAFWALARDLEAEGLGPITLGSLELGRILSEAAKDIKDVGWLYRCRILMVDDLGKERASPAAAALLWEVLDRRLSSNLPCIFTTNFEGKTFASRFSEQHLGESIHRRISELCAPVRFHVQTAPKP